MKRPWRLTLTRNRGHAYFWLMLFPRPVRVGYLVRSIAGFKLLIRPSKEMAPSRVGSAPGPFLGKRAVQPHRDVQGQVDHMGMVPADQF
jgi:hypothetical protein